ncbi:DNA replication/repair protein RecF [Auritidibacter sp. NML100628]|uniref:DNA replication/repair protein RecF n=1 Tax=Auritidibacter sp. NML100628 TaxID=2170742 RepID=UPI000D73160C|nr:DNA replication/repair protein RecF [Auritidibacter sp. NML100628]PXA77050.1 DNA replication/repair protein RecF [Auritidibacter sp. NML100628]
MVYISAFSLTNFRSYRQLDLTLEPGTNVLVGYNGVGKTNIAEALNYLATHRSHRVSHDGPLIHFGADQAHIRGRVHYDQRAVGLDLEINPGKSNRVSINRGAPQPAKEGLGLVRCVLFAPEDLQLLTGDPSVRRNFLDDLTVQLRPVMADARREYERVLKQRNALYKSAKKARRWGADEENTRQVFDEYLARAGARILSGRLHMLQLLAQPLNAAYQALAPGIKDAGFSYESTVGLAAGQHPVVPEESALAGAMLEELRQVHDQEQDRGLTLVGPHRDEVKFTLGPAPAKGYASHGETWSFALGLRLASYQVLAEDRPTDQDRPLLVLDDVFAELDAKRREKLAQIASQAHQVIVTAAVAEDLPTALQGPRFSVHADNGVSHVEGADVEGLED